jgi:hypothetical protein
MSMTVRRRSKLDAVNVVAVTVELGTFTFLISVVDSLIKVELLLLYF